MAEKTKNKFLMPGEWEKHSATWLAWPNDDDFFGERIRNIEQGYLKMIKALHEHELVKVLALDAKNEERIRGKMSEVGIDLLKIIFFHANNVDVWIRDYGPIFVKNDGEKAWVKFDYDGYGGKFPELLPDNNVFLKLKDSINFKMLESSLSLEGGAIDSNGKGTLLTTEECLLEHRNQGKTKEENEKILGEFLGAKNIIWLKKGLVNDHTDGHIDEVARFVSPSKIVCAYEDDIADENYERLKENYKILVNALDQDGNKFEVIKLPMPHMRYDAGENDFNGKKAPVSYTNFYIGNKIVLVSIFNDPNDAKAMEIIKSCFPDREVVGIDSSDLIYGGGAIHCITQQEP